MKSILILCIFFSVCAYGAPNKFIISHKLDALKTGGSNLGIVNGNDTTISKHPYLAAMVVENSIYCTGAILGKRWIISNAFCFRWVNYTEATFRVGSTRWNSGGQLVKVTAVYNPKEYNNDYDYNVALIKTAKPIKYNKHTKPIKMATKEPSDEAEVVVIGWGNTEKGTKGKLLEATVNVINRESCQNDYYYPYPNLTKRMLCAYKEKVGPCYNDEGAPLVSKNNLVGYFLGENQCAAMPAPQVYSSVANLRNWIKKTMKKNR